MAASIELLAGEEVVHSTEKHWIAPVRDSWIPALMIVGAFLIGSITPEADSGVGGFFANGLGLLRTALLVGGIAWIAYNIVVWRTATFAVTNMRVVREEGFLGRRSSVSMLTAVTDVQSRVPFLGARLGYGDLLIMGQAGEAASDRFVSISQPITFRDQLMAAAHGTRTDAPVTPAAAAAPGTTAGPAQSDELETIAKLAELRDAGAITAKEFATKKAEILSRI